MNILTRGEIESICVKALKTREWIKLKVKGNSMYPTLKDGDLVVIHRFNPGTHKLRPGDIVLVRAFDGVLLHRVVEIRENLVITKGDNNPLADEVSNVSDIVGIVEIPIDSSLEGFHKTYETRKDTLRGISFLIYDPDDIANSELINILEEFNVQCKFMNNMDELIKQLDNYSITIGITNSAPRVFESVISSILKSDNVVSQNNKQIAILLGARYGHSKLGLVPPRAVSHLARISSQFTPLSVEKELLYCIGVLHGIAYFRE